MQGNGGLLEPLETDVLANEAAQASVGNKVVAGAQEAQQPGDRVQGEDLTAAELSQTEASSIAVAGVCGREAMKAPFTDPTEAPTIRSGLIRRS